MIDCPRYRYCAAPICPLSTNKYVAIWYPDEEICKNRKMVKQFKYIKTQRKIKKKTKNRDTYYTLAMLEGIIGVRKETVGLNPQTVTDEHWIMHRKRRREEDVLCENEKQP